VSNPAVPGDITAPYALIGPNIGTGEFNISEGIYGGAFGDLQINAVYANGATPLPNTFAFFATGLCVLALLGWRRKRKNAAAMAVA
jgi:hypothetical protein